MPLALNTHELAPAQLGSWEEEWRALEASAGASFYLGWDWLSAWARVYAPERLVLLRATDGERPVALGLVEVGPRRRWDFAGGLVSAQRALLCEPGREEEAWRALADRLRERSREWSTLAAAGAPAAAAALPSAALHPVPVPGLDLPGSFDEYMSQRSQSARKGLKQKLRRLDKAGAEVREAPAQDRAGALASFLELHLARTESKGERHPQMDGRLLDLLALAGEGRDLDLHVFELVSEGRRAGVTVRLDHGGTGYFYNSGIDPEAVKLSPGIVLELGSIRDAIDRGLRRFDLGPEEYRYKRELGGVSQEWFGVDAASPSLSGRLQGGAARARRAARRLGVRTAIRRGARRAREAMPWS